MNIAYEHLKIGDAYLVGVNSEERAWIDSLNNPFGSHHTAEVYEVFMLERFHYHEEFNPFKSMIFYLQRTHVGEKENIVNTRNGKVYYINQPMFKPTGTFSIDHGSQTMTCLNGYLHDASGKPAMVSYMFGDAYYLHGEYYEPVEYFKLMEAQRNDMPERFAYRYPEYDPKKYIEFMAGVLGKK